MIDSNYEKNDLRITIDVEILAPCSAVSVKDDQLRDDSVPQHCARRVANLRSPAKSSLYEPRSVETMNERLYCSRMRKNFAITFLVLASVVLVHGPAMPAGASGATTGYEWSATSVVGRYRWSVVDTSADGSVAIAGYDLSKGKIRISRDSGATWAELAASPSASWNDVAMSNDGSTMVLAGSDLPNGSVWVSTDGGETFTRTLAAESVEYRHLAISGDGSRVLVASDGGVLLSTNHGTTFSPVEALTSLTNCDVAMTADGTTMFVAPLDGEIQRSVDGGETWSTLANAGRRIWTTFDVSADGETLFGVMAYGTKGVRMSKDGGETWSEPASVAEKFGTQYAWGDLSSDGTVLIAATYGEAPVISEDGGATWEIGGAKSGWTGFAVSGNGSRIYGVAENVGVRVRVPVAAPTVSGISGTLAAFGGSNINISGTNFVNVTSVTVAGVEETFTVNSRTSINVTPGPIAGATAVITVTTKSGSASTTAAVTTPGITNVSPNEGPATGGVTGGGTFTDVNGSFAGLTVTSAKIGDTPAVINFVTNSYVRITVPPGTSGTFDVILETAEAGQLRKSQAFTYYTLPAPAIETVTPSSVSWKGGDTLTLTGPGLGDAKAVSIAGKQAAIVERSGRSQIKVTAPAALVGAQDVTITNAVGTRTIAKAALYAWKKLNAMANWVGVGSQDDDGAFNGRTYRILAIATLPNGDVIVGGDFRNAAGIPEADYIARWDGSKWSALGSDGNGDGALNGGVFDVDIEDDGSIVAVGNFQLSDSTRGIGRFSSGTWSGVAGGLDGNARTVGHASDGDLYVGGQFVNVGGIPEADYLVRWDKQTNAWQALGSNGSGDGAFSSLVRALAVTGDGVVVGGHFTNAAGIATADHIARWNGSSWAALGSNGSGDGYIPQNFVTTSIDVATIEGHEAVLAGTCYNGGGDGAAQVFSSGQWTSVKSVELTSCVRDARLLPDGRMVIVGWFAEKTTDSESSSALVGSDALGWESLGDGLGSIDTIHIDRSRNRMFIGAQSSNLNNDQTADFLAMSSTGFLDRTSITVNDPGKISVTSKGGSTVTLTGTGFGSTTNVTIGDTPIQTVTVASPTQLTFTIPSGLAASSTLNVYNHRNLVAFANAIVVDDSVAPPPTTAGTAPKVAPPSSRQISQLPSENLANVPESLSPGSVLSVAVGGFTPGAWVYAYVASRPKLVGTGQADSTGKVKLKVAIPNLTGRHSLVLYDPVNGVLKRQAITISRTTLPKTGGSLGLIPIAVFLALIGLMIDLTKRRAR
jgi:hypothetical protein